jgi:hypothetical protein
MDTNGNSSRGVDAILGPPVIETDRLPNVRLAESSAVS